MAAKQRRGLQLATIEIALLLAGAAFAGLGIKLSDAPQDLATGFAVSCVTAVAVSVFRRWLDARNLGKLKEFFSEELVEGRGSLVFPSFVLREDIREDASHSLSDVEKGVFTKPSYDRRNTFRADIPECVATNDMHALAKFLALLQREGAAMPNLHDDDLGERSLNFLSVGLSSNNCTHLYFDMAKSKALFSIHPEKEPGRYKEYIRVHSRPTPVDYHSDDRREIGIFVRHRVRTDLDEPSTWMICAGLGPNGTLGASHYVTQRWRRLHERFGSADFIAIFSVPPAFEQTELLEAWAPRPNPLASN